MSSNKGTKPLQTSGLMLMDQKPTDSQFDFGHQLPDKKKSMSQGNFAAPTVFAGKKEQANKTNFTIVGNMNHLKANDTRLPLNLQSQAQPPVKAKPQPSDLYERLLDDQMAKGSNLFDQFADQLDFKN